MNRIPRRSALFMPAHNERAVNKAATLTVDIIILDLEDAVPAEQKRAARAAAVAAVESRRFGYREVLVRINGVDTAWWQEDLLALLSAGVSGIVVPKVESIEQITRVATALVQRTAPVKLWIMLESPLGIANATSLCAYGAPLAGVLVGTADLARAMRLPDRSDRLGLLTALSTAVLAARAAGLTILDGVFMNLRDADGLEAECRQGRDLGFDGKTLIHPAQLEITHRLYSPAADEIEDARGLLDAWSSARAKGQGVCVYRDRLVEHLHVSTAEELLAYADEVRRRAGI